MQRLQTIQNRVCLLPQATPLDINYMYRIRQQDLPFQGSSHQLVGADNGFAAAFAVLGVNLALSEKRRP